jgi:hypothetical protein
MPSESTVGPVLPYYLSSAMPYPSHRPSDTAPSSPSNEPSAVASPAQTTEGEATTNLESLISLSRILDSNTTRISSIGNINIIETDAAGSDDADDGTMKNTTIALCYMPMMFEFGSNFLGTYEGVASVALAMEHLNTGNGSIVRDLGGMNRTCPLRFITKAYDIGTQASIGVNTVIDLTDRVGRMANNGKLLLPCALLGADRSSVSMPTSIISGLRGFPQFSPISTSSELDDKGQYKLFGRTIPNDDGTSVPLISKLVSWNVRYFAVLHVDDSYGNAFARGIRSGVLKEPSILRVETIPLKQNANNETIADAIRQLKDTQFMYFFGVILFSDADHVMTEAYNQGIAGTGKHTWIFSDSVGSLVTGRNFSIGSPLEKSYRGTSILIATGGIPGTGVDEYDKLSTSLQVLGANEADRAYLDTLYPKSSSSEIFVNIPGMVGPFLYDAVVAIGLASCRIF